MDQATRKAELKRLLWPTLLPLVFFWREILGLNVFAGFDFTHLILPFQQFARDSLYAGHLPHWNPYLFAGFPQLAEGEGGIFYPGNLLLWLPGDQSVLLSWTVVLHLILTGCLMYAFLRNRGASGTTSAWLAIFYQFLPGLLLRAETFGLFEAVCWLPGLLWALERSVLEGINNRKSIWFLWTLMASGMVAMMLLAGSSQIAFYGMLGGFFYLCGLASMGPKPWSRAGWGGATLLLTAIFAAVLAAIQTVPTSIFAELSYRVQEADYSYYRIGTWLNFPRLASLFMFPAVRLPDELLDYISSLGYIGLFPFILISIALSRHSRHMNPILPAFILMFFGVILSFGLNLVINQDLITFPGFSLFRALGRMILPTVIAFFALAAVGLDQLFEFSRDDRNRIEIQFGILGALVVAIALLIWFLIHEGFPITGFEVIGITALIVASIISLAGLIGYIATRNRKWLIGLLSAWLIFQIVSMIPLKSAITMTRSSFNEAMNQLSVAEKISSDDTVTPPRVLVAIERDVWDPLLERLAANPFSTGQELPIPAFGNEFSMGECGVLNAYTPLVTEHWHTVAHEYAACGPVRTDEASNRLRNILALTRTDAVIAPGSYHGGDGFEPIDTNLDCVFPLGWHMLKVPHEVPYVNIPRLVEACYAVDWEWFKHRVVQENYIPGEVVCLDVFNHRGLPDTVRFESAKTYYEDVEQLDEDAEQLDEDMEIPNEDVGLMSNVWGVMELDTDSNSEIISVERAYDGRGHISIRARSDSPCWVVIRESYMDGWTATVDGSPAMIIEADYLFMAVPVTEGEHEILLTYETPGFVAGLWISSISWIMWLVILIIFGVRLRKCEE